MTGDPRMVVVTEEFATPAERLEGGAAGRWLLRKHWRLGPSAAVAQLCLLLRQQERHSGLKALPGGRTRHSQPASASQLHPILGLC